MTNVTVQEALIAAIELIQCFEAKLTNSQTAHGLPSEKVKRKLRDVISEIDKFEPVAEAIRERDRLGFAVVNVIGKLDEIIESMQEVEIDDFLHIAVPIDMWDELQDALEYMPKRADLYTSPQPIEKCEPVAWMDETNRTCNALSKKCSIGFADGLFDTYNIPLFTSPQPREWIGLNEQEAFKLWDELHPDSEQRSKKDYWLAIEAKLKQLNTKG